MTFTSDDCRVAIKNSTINPFFSYTDDWKQLRRFKTKSGTWAREFKSESFGEIVYVFEQESELVVSNIKPDIEWAYEIQPYVEWNQEHEIKFKVFDTDSIITGQLSNVVKQLPLGSIEIEDGVFTNENYTEYNFREIMMDLEIIDKTPELEPRPEKECKGECELCEEEEDDE